eukprot:scaffold61213_cov79-Phaeocystis_antarctica.AAC.5
MEKDCAGLSLSSHRARERLEHLRRGALARADRALDVPVLRLRLRPREVHPPRHGLAQQRMAVVSVPPLCSVRQVIDHPCLGGGGYQLLFHHRPVRWRQRRDHKRLECRINGHRLACSDGGSNLRRQEVCGGGAVGNLQRREGGTGLVAHAQAHEG